MKFSITTKNNRGFLIKPSGIFHTNFNGMEVTLHNATNKNRYFRKLKK